jgi:hypothetical protein
MASPVAATNLDTKKRNRLQALIIKANALYVDGKRSGPTGQLATKPNSQLTASMMMSRKRW